MPKGSELTWLSGIYRLEDNFPHFVILTRQPGEEIAFIHDRMPVMMPEDAVDDWISPKVNPDYTVRRALTECVYEKWAGREQKQP